MDAICTLPETLELETFWIPGYQDLDYPWNGLQTCQLVKPRPRDVPRRSREPPHLLFLTIPVTFCAQNTHQNDTLWEEFHGSEQAKAIVTVSLSGLAFRWVSACAKHLQS